MKQHAERARAGSVVPRRRRCNAKPGPELEPGRPCFSLLAEEQVGAAVELLASLLAAAADRRGSERCLSVGGAGSRRPHSTEAKAGVKSVTIRRAAWFGLPVAAPAIGNLRAPESAASAPVSPPRRAPDCRCQLRSLLSP